MITLLVPKVNVHETCLHAEQKGRIVVEKILDGSNAALGGLQVGDVIRGTTGRSKVCHSLLTVHVPASIFRISVLAMSSSSTTKATCFMANSFQG